MAVLRSEFNRRVEAALGAPDTAANRDLLLAWEQTEHNVSDTVNKSAPWNPLNTTQPAPGSVSAGLQQASIQAYPDETTGVQATAQTIKNGLYPTILADLLAGKADRTKTYPELLTWSNGGYSSLAGFSASDGPVNLNPPDSGGAPDLSTLLTAPDVAGWTEIPAEARRFLGSHLFDIEPGGTFSYGTLHNTQTSTGYDKPTATLAAQVLSTISSAHKAVLAQWGGRTPTSGKPQGAAAAPSNQAAGSADPQGITGGAFTGLLGLLHLPDLGALGRIGLIILGALLLAGGLFLLVKGQATP